MKTRHFIAALLLCTSPLAYAEGEDCHRLAVEGAIVTGGNFGIGIVDYTDATEIGFTISGTSNNAYWETKTVTPVLWAGLRYRLAKYTYFATGLDFNRSFGTKNGSHIDSQYQAGWYTSLEQMLSSHIMLVGWIHPYHYGHERLSGFSSVRTHDFFHTGGIGINYLF